MVQVDFITASSIATLLLSFVAGVLVTFVFSRRGSRGCIATIMGIAVLIIIVTALLRGYSTLIERATDSLAYYIQTNVLGVVGFVLGVVMTLLFVSRGGKE